MSSTAHTPRSPRARKAPTERPGPVGGKRDENRQKRTQALGEAALRLFLARGIELVTIDDIVGAAGVAKGSFYRYFEDKADLVAALLTPLATRMRHAFAACEEALAEARPGEPFSQPYQTLSADLVMVVMQDPDVVRLYLQESRTPAAGARKPIAALADEILKRAIALSEFARTRRLTRSVDARLTATAVVGAVEHLIFRFLAGDSFGPTEEIPSALISLVLDGMRSPKE